MRIADCGLRNGPCDRWVHWPAPRIGPSTSIPKSAIRNPQWLVGSSLLSLPPLACPGGGRTPLVVYSPPGGDLLTLDARRFGQPRPGGDVSRLVMGAPEVYAAQ